MVMLKVSVTSTRLISFWHLSETTRRRRRGERNKERRLKKKKRKKKKKTNENKKKLPHKKDEWISFVSDFPQF